VTDGALARAGLTVTGAFLVSRVLGWVRVVVLGNLFGAGAELDAYYAAFRIPDLMFQLVAAGAIGSSLIPVLTGLIASGERSRAERVASSVANLMLGALLILSVLMAVFAPVIVPWLVPGFDAETTATTVELTRLMLIAPIFLAAGAIASAVLNTDGRFGAAALAPVVYNVAIIAGAILLGPALGVFGAAVGVVVGAVATLLVQVPALRGRFLYRGVIDAGDRATRESFALMVPRAIGMGANQITFLVNTALATTVAVGAVVSYNVAFNVVQIPLGVIGLPLGVVLLPTLSRALADGRDDDFARMLGRSLRLLLWATLYVAVVGIVVRDPIIDALFGWGFDEAALAATAATLGVFLLGLPAHAMNVMLTRAFYSGRDTATPVAVAVASVAVNVIMSVLTIERLGLSGLALGIAVGAWFEAIVLTLLLLRRHVGLDVRGVLRAAGGALAGGLLAAAVALLTLAAIDAVAPADPVGAGVLGAALRVVAAGATSGVAYLVYSRLVRLAELDMTVDVVRAALRRR
jgi:putative peptidoglycan lipid II flippase